jgi:hypothetical protein
MHATRRLEELVAGGALDFVKVACSCRPGTEGTPKCNYAAASDGAPYPGRAALLAKGNSPVLR